MMKIRNLDINDLPQCTQLFEDTFSKEPWFDNDSMEDIKMLFMNHMNNNYFVGYVLLDDIKIVGLSLGFSKPWIRGMEYYIDQFVIEYGSQGKGYGSKFIELIDTDIKNKGMNAIILNTEKGYPAEKFYLKNGFSIIDNVIVLGK